MDDTKIYYQKNNRWRADYFYYLNKYFDRMLKYYDKNVEEIKSLNLNRMTVQVKAMLKCLLEIQHKEYFVDIFLNLGGLKKQGSLTNPIYLEEMPDEYKEIYAKYNIHTIEERDSKNKRLKRNKIENEVSPNC